MKPRVAIVKAKHDPETAVEEAINLLGGIEQFIAPGETVLLKPNLFTVKGPDTGATTDMRVVLGAARLLMARESHCIVGECPATASYTRPEIVFDGLGIWQVCEENGVQVKVLDRDPPVKVSIDGVIAQDFWFPETCMIYPVINFPKLKTHALTTMTAAVKNKSIEVKDSLTKTESMLLANHYIKGEPNKKRLVLKHSRGTELIDKFDGFTHWSDVALELDGKRIDCALYGKGTVDAFMNAVKYTLGMKDVELPSWNEKAVYSGKGAYGYDLVDTMKFSTEEEDMLHANGYESKGQEAIAKSIIELLYQGEIFYGRGSGKDIVDATKEAIINGFDAIYRLKSI